MIGSKSSKDASPPTVLEPRAQPHSPAPRKAPAPIGMARRPHPLASLRRHKGLALALLLLAWLIGVPVAWKLGTARYETEASIYVSPRFLKNLDADQEQELQSNSQYREFVQQQIRTVTRYDILRDALRANPALLRAWQKRDEGEQRAIERLQAELIVRAVPDTYQFTIGLQGDKRDNLAETVNAVARTFLEKDKKDELYGKDHRLQELREEQDRLTAELAKRMDARTAIAQELGVTTFNESLLNPYDQLLINRKNELAMHRTARIEKESEYVAISPQDPRRKESLAAEAGSMTQSDSGLNSLKASLYKRRSDLLTTLSGLGPNHPGRKAAELELQELEAEIQRATGRLTDENSRMLAEQRKTQVDQTRRTEQQLDSEVRAQADQASRFAARYQEAVRLGVEIDRIHKRLSAVDARINFFTLEAQAPGFTRLFSEARTPDLPVKGGKAKYLLLVLVAGLLLALIAPMAVDLVDPRLHTTEEVESLLGFAPLGGVLGFSHDPARRLTEDQLLRLASAFAREHRANGSRVFLFTAASGGHGATAMVLEIARKLEELGVNAIAVAAPGFTQMRGKAAEAESAPAGRLLQRVASADHAASVPAPLEVDVALPIEQRLRALVNGLANSHDVILLDAPPLLRSAESELLAGAADATVLFVAASLDTKSRVLQVMRRMERLRLPAVSVIVHRLDPARDPGSAAMLAEYRTGRAPAPARWFAPWTWS